MTCCRTWLIASSLLIFVSLCYFFIFFLQGLGQATVMDSLESFRTFPEIKPIREMVLYQIGETGCGCNTTNSINQEFSLLSLPLRSHTNIFKLLAQFFPEQGENVKVCGKYVTFFIFLFFTIVDNVI